MKPEETDPDFEIEGIGFGKKAGYDKPSLVAEAVRSCISKRSQEMRPGYKSKFLDRMGNAHIKIVPDSRKEYVGSVIGLTALISFEIRNFKDIKKKYDIFKKTKKKMEEKYIYSERTFKLKKDSDGKQMYELNGEESIEIIIIPNGRKWLPEETDLLSVPRVYTKKAVDSSTLTTLSVEKESGGWKLNVDTYWNEMIELCDEWFSEMTNLISDDLDNYGKGMGL